MKLIEINELDYWYPGEQENRVLKDINLNINEGEFILITGSSGSGKSTLAKAITGAVPNFYGGRIKGKITYREQELSKIQRDELVRNITMVFQDPERQLLMNKVHREIAFGLENVGEKETKIKRRVWECLQFSGTLQLAFRDINTLSGGEKQKIAIAAALSYLPQCIILDEPTSQLDPAAAEEIVSLIKKINEELGITIIVIEQRLDKWFEAADRIVVLEKGEKKFDGSKKELYSQPDSFRYLPLYLKLAKNLDIELDELSIRSVRESIRRISFRKHQEESEIDNSNVLELKNVSCYYGSDSAVKNLNLKIKQGEFLGLMGANGAGKSTLLKALISLVKYEGSIKLHNKEIKSIKISELSRVIGYVSQNPNDYLTKDSIYEELKFTLDNFKQKDYSIIEEVLKKLNLWDLKDKNPRDISGGERQRAAIGSILVMKPKVLLLDEPTRGLDYENRKALGEVLKALNNEGTTIILVTHDVDFAADFCGKFALMFQGEIVSSGNKEEVLKDGVYYTTTVSKLLRLSDKNIYTLEQAVRLA